ncbi:MAG: PAS domain S-box protein [Candidatus Kapaibacterium sp.]
MIIILAGRVSETDITQLSFPVPVSNSVLWMDILEVLIPVVFFGIFLYVVIREFNSYAKQNNKIIDRLNNKIEEMDSRLDLYTKLIDNVPGPAYIKDRDKRYIGCNKAFELFTAQSKDDIIGKTVWDLYNPEYAKIYDSTDDKLFSEDNIQMFETIVEDYAGRKRNVVFRKSCYHNAGGEIAGIVGTFWDVTDFHAAEEELLIAKNNAEMLYKVTPSGLFTIDNNNRIKTWNSRVEEITGYSAEEAVGKTPEFLSVTNSESCTLTKVISADPRYGLEQKIRNKKGLERIVLTNTDLLKNSSGETTGKIISFEDITARKEIEKELYLQSGINLAIADLSEAILSLASLKEISDIILERALKLTGSNLAFVGYNDLKSGSLIIPSFTDDIFTTNGSTEKKIKTGKLKGYLKALTEKHEPILMNNNPGDIGLNGTANLETEFRKLCIVPAVFNKKLMGIIAIANADRDYDFSHMEMLERMASLYAVAIQRVRSEDEILAVLENENMLFNLKTRFIASSLHEYRTPLTSIALSSDLLFEYSDKLSPGERETQFNNIKDSIRKMKFLLDEVVTFNELEIGKMRFSPSKVNVYILCAEVVSNTQYMEKGRYKIRMNFEESHFESYLDEEIIKRVLTNLLIYMIKYSPSYSTIDFTIETSEDEIEFTLRDEALYLPNESGRNLFDPGLRSAKSSCEQAIGFSLAIATHMIGIHGGSIDFKSDKQGISFFLKVPLVDKKLICEKVG